MGESIFTFNINDLHDINLSVIRLEPRREYCTMRPLDTQRWLKYRQADLTFYPLFG
ncbi:MAG: hypothetical protein ACJAUL_001154 [Paraglaciecola sp.]|jgi:hypothetical protein